jgi:hypothetical protein
MKILSLNSLHPGQDSNQVPLEYKSETLVLQPAC